MDLDETMLLAEEQMDKAVEYAQSEMKGIRTGRASTGLVEYVKVEYYGSPTDLRQLASISTPEATQILIKPFDASSVQDIRKALEAAGLGLNPQVEGKQIRLNLPPLTGERRQQLISSVKSMGEGAKVTIRNARRDANKGIDAAEKDKSQSLSEDDIKAAKEDINEMTKKYEAKVDGVIEKKVAEVQEV